MSGYLGMSADTGVALTDLDHIRQSIRDILTTPIGTRVMRREYGSLIPKLIDAPLNAVTVQRVLAATVTALLKWEPRIRINRVQLTLSDDGAGLTIDLDAVRTDTEDLASLSIPLRGGL